MAYEVSRYPKATYYSTRRFISIYYIYKRDKGTVGDSDVDLSL